MVPAQLCPPYFSRYSCWPHRTRPREARLEQTVLTIYWMWQQKDTHYELRDNLWQGTLSVILILSDKNIVTGGHLGNKEAGVFQVI